MVEAHRFFGSLFMVENHRFFRAPLYGGSSPTLSILYSKVTKTQNLFQLF